MHLVQMCVQGRWISDCSLLTLPYLEEHHILQLNEGLAKSRRASVCGVEEIASLAELLAFCEYDERFLSSVLGKTMTSLQLRQVRVEFVFHRYSIAI